MTEQDEYFLAAEYRKAITVAKQRGDDYQVRCLTAGVNSLGINLYPSDPVEDDYMHQMMLTDNVDEQYELATGLKEYRDNYKV